MFQNATDVIYNIHFIFKGKTVTRIMVNITVDNSGRLITDSGEKRNVVCMWSKVKHFTLSGHTKHVTIKAYKARGKNGILASFSNNVVTDESWQCANMDGCISSDCESFAATKWSNATAYGFNIEDSDRNSREKINEIKSTAQWIWAKNGEAERVWCRKGFGKLSRAVGGIVTVALIMLTWRSFLLMPLRA
jgi:hypothetical protein